jgi:hypothetical protein
MCLDTRAAAVLPVHASPSTKLTSPCSIYHGHLPPTQMAVKKYEGSVACSAILDQKFVPGTIIDSHFQITSGPHGDFIACTQKEKPIRVNPVDVSVP